MQTLTIFFVTFFFFLTCGPTQPYKSFKVYLLSAGMKSPIEPFLPEILNQPFLKGVLVSVSDK